VVEVFPNGNLRIEGGKTITVNREEQIIVLTGIVRPNDISSQNIINSKYVLDAKIAYTGKGVISDKQGPGWMTRILDNVWPF
jgi:flagellar L-ring protein precursor FlgH